MKYIFSERAWTPQDVLNYWQEVHGKLDPAWEVKFLNNPFVKEICVHHPAHIRSALARSKKVEFVLNQIMAKELENEESVEELLNEPYPYHAFGITNAHHGDRTTDPFDSKRDELLFKCQNCNLKLSNTLRTTDTHFTNTCTDCVERNS